MRKEPNKRVNPRNMKLAIAVTLLLLVVADAADKGPKKSSKKLTSSKQVSTRTRKPFARCRNSYHNPRRHTCFCPYAVSLAFAPSLSPPPLQERKCLACSAAFKAMKWQKELGTAKKAQ